VNDAFLIAVRRMFVSKIVFPAATRQARDVRVTAIGAPVAGLFDKTGGQSKNFAHLIKDILFCRADQFHEYDIFSNRSFFRWNWLMAGHLWRDANGFQMPWGGPCFLS